MGKAKEILKFRFNKEDWHLTADTPFSPLLAKVIARQEKELEKITLSSNSVKALPAPEIIFLYRQFFSLAPKGLSALEQEFNTARKIRKLTAALSMRSENLPSIFASEHLRQFLELISKYWKDTYIKNLAIGLLKEWGNLKRNPENEMLFRPFLREKVSNYQGNKQSILRFRIHAQYFLDETGDIHLAQKILEERPDITSLLKGLFLNEGLLSSSYFSRVFFHVTRRSIQDKSLIHIYRHIASFLTHTHDPVAPKKIIPLLIQEVENDELIYLKDKVRELAFSTIGDPARKDKWSPWAEASLLEKERLRESREIINRWINKEFIHVFFERILMDPDRRDFWLDYTDSMSRVYVYGNPGQWRRLQGVESIQPYLKERFRFIKNENQGAALVIFLPDYCIIEFTDVGAIYCYQDTNPFVKRISTNRPLSNIAELKKPEMGLAINSEYHANAEGRIVHSGRWQGRLRKWLSHYPRVQMNQR